MQEMLDFPYQKCCARYKYLFQSVFLEIHPTTFPSERPIIGLIRQMPNLFKALFALLCMSLTTGCWQSTSSQFNTESLLISNLPERMVVSFNGATGVISRVEGSQTTYEGFGFDEIKFKDVRMGIATNMLVQVRNTRTGQYYFLIVGNGKGFARDLINGADKLQIGTGFPARGGTVDNNKFSPPVAGTKLSFKGAVITVTDIDDMSEEQVALLLDAQKERSAAGRFDRAIWQATLANCNQAFAFMSTGSLGALMNNYTVQGDRCIVANAFSKISLGFDGVENLQCNEGNPRTCRAQIRFNCLMTSSVANDQRLNRSVCDVYRAARLPVIFTARDDGQNVSIEQFEFVTP